METITAALIALFGTIATALVGLGQWKKQHATSRQESFRLEKYQAYKKLWEMLEEIHVKLRSDEMGKDEFTVQITQVNSFVLKNSIYIDKKDGILATQYTNSVYELSKLIQQSKNKRAKRAWSITSDLPPDTLDEHDTLKTAWSEVDENRDKLVKKFQMVLKGEK